MKGLLIMLCFLYVNGHMHFRLRIPNGYNVTHPCPDKGLWEAVGHMKTSHTPQKNVFGLAFRNNGKEWTRALCMEDSDGDGLSNGEELGDPACEWTPGTPVAGKVRGHPGFCEQNRETCSSGMTHPDCPNPKAKESIIKKPRIRLPPGANDHPQTLKFKELMRSGQLNTMRRDRRISFTQAPGGRQQWLERRGQVSNQPNMPSRMTARRQPMVGQSVFGQAPLEPSRNLRGQFDRRDRNGQPLPLSRDFGLRVINEQQNGRNRVRTPVAPNNVQRQRSRWNTFNGGSPFMRSAGQIRQSGRPDGLQSQPRTNRISMRGSFQAGTRTPRLQASGSRFLRF